MMMEIQCTLILEKGKGGGYDVYILSLKMGLVNSQFNGGGYNVISS